MCNLPDGVTDDMLPGGSQADAVYEKLADQVPADCTRCGTRTVADKDELQSTTARGFRRHIALEDLGHDAELRCDRALDDNELLELVADAAEHHLKVSGVVPDQHSLGNVQHQMVLARARLRQALETRANGRCGQVLATHACVCRECV